MTVFSGLLFYDFSFLFSNVFTCFHVYDQKPETRAFSIAYIYIFFLIFLARGGLRVFVYIYFFAFFCVLCFSFCVYMPFHVYVYDFTFLLSHFFHFPLMNASHLILPEHYAQDTIYICRFHFLGLWGSFLPRSGFHSIIK